MTGTGQRPPHPAAPLGTPTRTPKVLRDPTPTPATGHGQGRVL